MSEKFRNESVNEKPREEMIQKDIQSPSVSSFDQKKDFFENVSEQQNVPPQEIQTEQKKEIQEDLGSIGQIQKGKTFEEKKEFFENLTTEQDDESQKSEQGEVGSFQKVDLKNEKERECSSKDQPKERVGSSFDQEKRSSQSQKDLSFDQGKEKRSSQQREWKNQPEQGKEGSYQQGEWKNQPEQGKESSLGMGSIPQEKERSSGKQEECTSKKEGSFGSSVPQEKEKGSSLGMGSSIPQQQGSSYQQGEWKNQPEQGKEGSYQQGEWKNKPEQGKESSLGMGSIPQEKERSSGKQEECTSKKEDSFGSSVPQEKGKESSLGMGSSIPQQQGSSYQQGEWKNKPEQGKESSFQQGKDSSSGKQGDLMSFTNVEQNREREKQQDKDELQSSESSVQQQGKEGDWYYKQQSPSQSQNLGDQQQKGKESFHPHPRIKGFEPKDPKECSNLEQREGSNLPNDTESRTNPRLKNDEKESFFPKESEIDDYLKKENK